MLLTVVLDGLRFAEAATVARNLTAGSEENWSAARAAVDPSLVITDPADARSTFQQAWHGELGFFPNDQGPGPFDVDTEDLSSGHWQWDIAFCTDPA